jgi:hypothetical protein
MTVNPSHVMAYLMFDIQIARAIGLFVMAETYTFPVHDEAME